MKSSTKSDVDDVDWRILIQSNYALRHHRFCDLEEASDVGTEHVISGLPVLLSSLVSVLMNPNHDVLEFTIDSLAGPTHAEAVLTHL